MSSSIVLLPAPISTLFESVQNDVCHLDYKIFRADEDKKVLTGPFKGMQLCSDTRWKDGNLCLKIFGHYEHELHASIEKAIARNPKLIFNIGCGEGYYAVGMALRLPNSMVHGVDVSSEALRFCREAAEINGVADRVNVGLVNEDLPIVITSTCLLIIDNEGAEETVIERLRGPEGFDIIVECHDFMEKGKQKGISDRLIERLSPTHDVERIGLEWIMPVNPYGWQSLLLQSVIMTEKRSLPSCWLACWSKS